jgi:hypothetical protein
MFVLVDAAQQDEMVTCESFSARIEGGIDIDTKSNLIYSTLYTSEGRMKTIHNRSILPKFVTLDNETRS